MRQRTIPVKQEIEVQTDVNLMVQPHTEVQDERVLLSELMAHKGLLNPFADPYLLSAYSATLTELKSTAKDQDTQTRLHLLQHQLEGLLKRTTMLQNGKEYYSLLLAKDKELEALQQDSTHTNAQLRKMKAQLQLLESELSNTRIALATLQQITEKSKHYEDTIASIGALLRTRQRPQQMVKAMEDQILPLLNTLDANTTAINNGLRSLPHSIRAIADAYAKDLERLLKDPSQDRLKHSLMALNSQLQSLLPDHHSQWEKAARCQQAETSYRNMLSLMRGEIERLRQDNPNLKALTELDGLLQTIDRQNVGIVECKGVMQVTKYETKVQNQPTNDNTTRGTLLLLSNQLTTLLQTYPQLTQHVPLPTRQLLQQIPQLVSSDTLQRLQSMMVSNTQTIRVDNVYKYEDTRDRQQLFNLRVLVKALLEQLTRQQNTHGFACSLDESVMEMVREQALDNINEQSIRALFRPMARVVEVNRVMEVPTFEVRTIHQNVPLMVETPLILRENHTQVVQVRTQVPIYVQKPVEVVLTKHVPIERVTEKVIEVTLEKDVLVERMHERQVQQQFIVEKVVSAESVREVPFAVEVERVIEVPRVVEVERIVQQSVVQYKEVEVIKEVPVVLYETRHIPQEIEVRVQRVVQRVEYVEIQRRVPYIVKSKEVVYLEKEKPIVITQVVEKEVPMIEYRDRLIPVKEISEVIREVPVIHQKEIIREVPKEIYVTRSHFVKGDRVETCREVEVVVEKPVIQEVLVVRDLEVQKMVPLYVNQQVLVPTEVRVPCVTERVIEVERESVRIVPVIQQVIKEVVRDKPIPVVMEKEIIRIQTQIIEKIVQKIIQVPRVVEVEKIVEKIVVVPRIVERIVQVEKIVQKIVMVETPVLQIVQIQIPMIVIQEVEKIKEVIVEKEVIKYVTETQVVEKDKVVQLIISKEVPVEVTVERRIPVEILRQIPVEVFRDRIQYQRVEIHEVKVETIEVNVPVVYQEKVPFHIEKPVVREKIVERIVAEKQFVERPVALRTEVSVPTYVELKVQYPIVEEVIREIPGPQTIYYVPEYKEIQLVSEKVVTLQETREIPRQVYLTSEKLVERVVERIVEVPVSEAVMVDRLVEITRPISVMSYKEIPIEVPVYRDRALNTLTQQIIEVPTVREKAVQTHTYQERLVQVINSISDYIREQVVREIQVPHIITNTITNTVQVPSAPIITNTHTHDRTVQIQDRIVERILEKVVMMPQVVEVVRNIHHVSEINALPIAQGDQETYLQQYGAINNSLKTTMEQLLNSLKQSRMPEARQVIDLLQQHIPLVQQWIRFPKVLQIEKPVQKQVEKEKVVLVPTENKDKIAAMSFMLEKCVSELKRLRQTYKIDLNIDEEVLKIFFNEQWQTARPLQNIMHQLTNTLKNKYSSFGTWSESAPFMINCFMEQHFALQALIEQSNRTFLASKEQNTRLKEQINRLTSMNTMEQCTNRVLNNSYFSLIDQLKRQNGSLSPQQITLAATHFSNIPIQLQASGFKDNTTLYSKVVSGSILNHNTPGSLIGHHTPGSLMGHHTPGLLMGHHTPGSVIGNNMLNSKVGPHNSMDSMLESKMAQSTVNNMPDTKQTQSVYHFGGGQDDQKTLRLQKRNAQLTKALTAAEHDINILRETMRQREIQITALKQKQYSVGRENNKETTDVRGLQEKVRGLQWEIERRNKETEKKGKEVQQNIDRLQKNNERQLFKVKQQLEREQLRVKGELERVIRDRENEISETKRKHNDEVNALKATQSRLAQTTQSSTQVEIMQLKTKVNELTQQMDNERTKIIASSSQSTQQFMLEINQLKKKCTDLEAELQNERLKKSGEQGNNLQMVRLRNKITELEMDLNKEKRKQIQPSQSTLQNTQLKKKIIFLESQIQRLKNQIQRLKRQLQLSANNYRKATTERSNQTFQQKMEVEKMKGESERLRRELQGVQRERVRMEEQQQHEWSLKSTDLENRLREMINNYNSLETNYNSLQMSYNALQSSGFDNRSSNSSRVLDNKSAEYRAMEAKCNSLEMNVFTAQTAKNTLQTKTRDLQRQLYQLQIRSMNESNTESNDLRNKLRRLQIELETKTRQIEIQNRERQSSANVQRMSTSIGNSPEPFQNILRSPQSIEMSPSYVRHLEEQYVSSEDYERQGEYSSQMFMSQLIQVASNVDRELFGIMVIIKILEKVEEEVKRNPHYNFQNYSTRNIVITSFNPSSLETMQIIFKNPINLEEDQLDGLYLAPQILRGEQNTRRSFVFNLGIILDQLLHGELFFSTIEAIKDPKNEFRVRDEHLNPILKNSLFEIMNKEPSKRLELTETKRRLQLLSYIAKESRNTLTATRSPSHRASNH